jgi:Flp pilus assembly CpaE family ATPase
MDMLRGFQKNLAQESDVLKQAVTPFVEEQKKVCWAFEINASKTIPELNAVGKAIADDGNKSLHTALHAVYGAKVKALKESLKEKKNDN